MENLQYRSPETQKSPLLELKKEDIYPLLFNTQLEWVIWKYFSNKYEFLPNEKLSITSENKNKILNILTSKWINLENISWVLLFSNWEFIISFIDENSKEIDLHFKLEQEKNIFKWSEEELKQQKEQENILASRLLSQSDTLLAAMDQIFKKNNSEWWFQEINKEDVVTQRMIDRSQIWIWDLKWKNLLELQTMLQKIFEKLKTIPEEHLWKTELATLIEQEKIYMDMFIWIWDMYEWWASFLKETRQNLKAMLERRIKYSSPESLIAYLRDTHTQIDDNNYQSTSVERSYEWFTKEFLHKMILESFIKNNVEDKYILQFAKIVTWRWDFDEYNWVSDNFKDIDIDNNLRDQDMANEAIIFMMNRKWWILKKLWDTKLMQIEDEKIKDKNPYQIVRDFEGSFNEKFWWNTQWNHFRKQLKNSGYWDIFKIWESEKYIDLDFSQKTKLSVVYRVLEKMKEKSRWSWKEKYWLNDFAWLFNEIAKDYKDDMVDKLEDMFDSDNPFPWEWFWFWKNSQDLKESGIELSKEQSQAFDLFQETIWNGIFNLSETSISNLKSAWVMAWTVAIAMAVPILIIPSATLLVQWAAAWAAASLASMALSPKWYDTIWEATTDISTDLTVWAAFGVAGWALWSQFSWVWKLWWRLLWNKAWVEWARREYFKQIASVRLSDLPPEWKIQALSILASDMILLWFIPESYRMKFIDWVFHNEENLINLEKNIYN